MKCLSIVCLALVALAVCNGAQADVDASFELKKSLSLGLPAGEHTSSGPAIMNMAANPSAPPEAEPQVLLALPRVSVDLDITKQKVPLLSVADVPCKQLCKNKCDIKMEKTCINVTLPKKECEIGSRTITKKFCEKRCKPSLELQLPAFKLPKLPKTVPANTNPSAPPATLQTAASSDVSLSADASASVVTSATVASSATADVRASVGGALSALQDLVADKLPKSDLDVDCRDVCVEMPIVLPELECSESSRVVEKCTFVPEKTCSEECVCLPQKSLTLSLPKKPSLTVAASVESVVG